MKRKFKRLKKREELIMDDFFSRQLEKQGKDGQFLRLLYLQEPMVTYQKQVLDQPMYW